VFASSHVGVLTPQSNLTLMRYPSSYRKSY